MSDVNTDLQDNAQLAAGPEDAIRAVVDERFMALNTQCPGIIKSFDRAKMTATVQPVHKHIYIDVGAVEVPVCTDVPVHFPKGGNVILTFDPQEGDECILWFSQRCIDEWFQNGGTQAPGEHRFHSMSDGMASVGIESMARSGTIIGGVAAGGAELRTRDGTVLVRVDDDNVWVGSKDPTPITGARPALIADLANAADPMTLWLTSLGTVTGAGPPPTSGMTTIMKAK